MSRPLSLWLTFSSAYAHLGGENRVYAILVPRPDLAAHSNHLEDLFDTPVSGPDTPWGSDSIRLWWIRIENQCSV